MSYRVPQQRAGSTPKGFHQRDEYEDELDEYEEEASEDEEDVVPEPPKPTKEEQDFLKLREQLKSRFRQKIRKQGTQTPSQLSQSRDMKSVKNNTFGSFFGPSQPVIASRVIEESRSIRETKHITENMSTSKKRDSTALRAKTENYQHQQQPRVVNEAKNKAQTLKDMRDYSFLFSDDADIPVVKEQPALRKASAPKSDGPSSQSSLKSKISTGKPSGASSTSTELKKPARMPSMQRKPVHTKESPIKRPVIASAQSRKLPTGGSGNRPIKPTGSNALPQKAPAQNTSMNKPVRKVMEAPSLKKNIQSLKPNFSGVKHEVNQKRSAYVLDRQKPIKQPMHSTKAQPSKQNVSRGSHGDDARKPPKRKLSDDEDVDYRSMIRGMFGYNPNKYAANDDDDSDMEADFATIQKEERRSAKIARQEDEEQLRLIEEEEERERQRRMKKKLKRG